ncbi:MAG: hypothetical protein HOJ48_04765 [Desulfobacula sp.]|jgi:hypothetical protein|nr:hypothetical protein [Desulfobacula sp.]
MKNDQDQFSITERPLSGCQWMLKEFAEIRSPRVKKTQSFLIPEVLGLLYKSLRKELGKSRAFRLVLRTSTMGYVFNRPLWHPEYFKLTDKKQEMFYKNIFKKAMLYFIMFNLLKKEHGDEKADKIIANIINPATIAYMKRVYRPVGKCTTIEPWWEQSVDYIADLPEDNQGLEGTVYMAEDLSELKWHNIRCATAEVFRAYGLKLTMSHMCMTDHITYHTFFPGLMFKRTSCIGVGDAFCDHHAWVKTPDDMGKEEVQYGDCDHFEGGREYVRYWEEYAKGYLFGSKEKWQRYAEKSMIS